MASSQVAPIARLGRRAADPGVGGHAQRFTEASLQELMARYRDHAVVKLMLVPVLGTQKFTTREPDDSMLEVAIAAFRAAREGEEESAAPAALAAGGLA